MRPLILFVGTLACVCALAPPVSADPPTTGPNLTAVPPQLATCVPADEQHVEIYFATEKLVFEGLAPPVAGVKPDRNVAGFLPPDARARSVTEMRARRIDLEQLAAEHVDGSKVSQVDLLKQLGKGAPVVLGNVGQKIDPSFLSLFKPDTLVLLLPPATSPVSPPAIALSAKFQPVPASPAPALPKAAPPAIPRKFGS